MKRFLCSTLLVAAAALAGCDQSDHNITAQGPYDPQAANAAAPVTLPPAIAASKAYRCKDNSLVYIDWYSDGSARVKPSRTDLGTVMSASDVAALNGDAQSTSVTHNGQTCHV